jgi:hypothetical protein
MTYGDIAEVKPLLNLEPDMVELDNKIDDALTRADNWINYKLKRFTGTPLVSPDNVIVNIANDYAAGLLIDEGDTNPSSTSTAYAGGSNPIKRRAEKNLNEYIRITFGVDPEADVMKGTVMGDVHISKSSYLTDEMQSEFGE